MKTVIEVSRLTGVSVRTLHYYDQIGLLRPDEVTPAGYRLYDDTALERLQHILLFRELRFSLRQIGEILDSPDFDRNKALEQQISLLRLQRERLDGLIGLACDIKEKGVEYMDFQKFDQSKLETYKAEAKAAWGGTEAYREWEQKQTEQTPAEQRAAQERLLAVFAELGGLRELPPDDGAVQAIIVKLREQITADFYTCTAEILRGLGQMYEGDPRMKKSIDQAGGPGTAALAAKAIEIYCSGK